MEDTRRITNSSFESPMIRLTTSERLVQLEVQCESVPGSKSLLMFVCVISILLLLFSVPLNTLIIHSIRKNKKKKFKSVFYRLLLNIAAADLIKSILTNTLYINCSIKDVTGTSVSKVEHYAMQISLFFTDTAALLTVALLSFDRIAAVLYPIRYHNGLITRKENALVLLTWPMALLLVLPYFWIHFIKELLLFSIVNISLAGFSLITTTVLYKTRILNNTNPRSRRVSTISEGINNYSIECQIESPKDSNNSRRDSSTSFVYGDDHNFSRRGSSGSMLERRDSLRSSGSRRHARSLRENAIGNIGFGNEDRKSVTTTPFILHYHRQNDLQQHHQFSHTVQTKATRAFLLILVVFFLTYLPTCVLMLYMNVCTSCNCVAIHAMNDMAKLSIISSSLLRPSSFLFSLRHLNESVKRLLCKPRNKTRL